MPRFGYAQTPSELDGRVRSLRPHIEQQGYLLEQLARAFGEDWVHANAQRVESWWDAIVELGYALPDEPLEEEAAA